MNRRTIDHEAAFRAAAARSLVATVFVMGLAALVWTHVDFETGSVPVVERALSSVPACTDNDCLHVPAGDPSVPAADSVFARGGASTLDVPPVPTF